MLEQNFYRRLGRRLRIARKLIDFSPEGLAAELCLSAEDYRRIEAGEACIDLPALVAAATITGKSTDFLLTGRSTDRAATS